MPKTLPSGDGRVSREEDQAAELLAELDEDEEVDEDGFESDDEEPEELDGLDDEEPEDFEDGLLLDDEPRLSLR